MRENPTYHYRTYNNDASSYHPKRQISFSEPNRSDHRISNHESANDTNRQALVSLSDFAKRVTLGNHFNAISTVSWFLLACTGTNDRYSHTTGCSLSIARHFFTIHVPFRNV